MRLLLRPLGSLALCALVLGSEPADCAGAVAALPKGWRFRELVPCVAGTDGRFPCAIAEDCGRVAIAFPEAERGRLCVSTNLFAISPKAPRPEWGKWPRAAYWETTTLGKERLACVDMTIAQDVVLSWVPWDRKYDPRWAASVGGPGRWQVSWDDPEAPPMPTFPALALAHAGEGRVYAVHNDPKSGQLVYSVHPENVACPPAIPVGSKEDIVSLSVQASGTIHALTFLEGNLYYLTNKGGQRVREVFKTGELVGLHAAIAADNAGAPHVAYRDTRTGGLLYCARSVSSTWASSVVERGPGVGTSSAISVDPHGKVHILYTTDTGVHYATNAAGNWRVFSLSVGTPLNGCDVTVDAQGYVHACYAVGAKMIYATNRPENED